MAVLALATALSAAGLKAEAQEIYKTDQGHTELLIGWNHAGVSRQHGEFTQVEATLTLDAENPQLSTVEATIDTSSIHTGFAPLDDRLKSNRWMDVAKFPQMEFKSTSVEVTGKKSAKITGELTLFGITKPLILDVELTHRGQHPVAAFIEYYKGEWLAFRATGKVTPIDFGVGPYSTGPISIEINTELKRQ